MNKKLRSVLLVMLIALFCLALFAGCKTEKVSIFDYSADEIGLVGKLVMLMHKWIGNYGWTVVVFTVFLKIVMLPLDFWQRYSSRKGAIKMQKMQPLMEEIDRRYGANTQRANAEKQKLYQKQGYSMMSQCLPMILSMVIFFVMFGGLRDYSTFSSITTFNDLSATYYNVYAEKLVEEDGQIKVIFDKAYQKAWETVNSGEQIYTDSYKKLIAQAAGIKAVAQDSAYNAQCAAAEQAAVSKVQQRYKDTRESWLWIQNVWQPDTWDTIMPQFDKGTNSFTTTVDMNGFPDDSNGRTTYNIIRNAVLQVGERGESGKWNGLMILPLLSIVFSFLSMFISQRLERKNNGGAPAPNQQQNATNKTMMIMMPLMMAWFGFMYTGAFAIYMVVNYAISIGTTVGLRYPVEKLVQKNLAKANQKDNGGKASYMR